MKIYNPKFESSIIQTIYSASGEYSYQIPSGSLWLDVELFGGGGGGGGGAKHADDLTSAYGGMPGGYSFYKFVVTEYNSSSIHVAVGAGGVGGAAISSSASSSGFAGTTGGDSYISSGSTVFCIAGGGRGGQGATLASLGINDSVSDRFIISDLPMRRRQTTATFNTIFHESASYNKIGGTGGHGGHLYAAAGRYTSAASGSSGYYTQNYAGGGGLVNQGQSALSGSNGHPGNWPLFQTGGGGGGGAPTGSNLGGPGGSGGIGAGGGGGGSTFSATSGKGGNGGSGGVKIVAHF